MISIKFWEEDGGWNTNDIRGGYGTGLWKDVIKECDTFSQNTTFSLGNGRRLDFWKDSWCGENREIALCNVQYGNSQRRQGSKCSGFLKEGRGLVPSLLKTF